MSSGWTVGYGTRGATNSLPPEPGTIPATHNVGLSASTLGLNGSETSKRQATMDIYAHMASELGITAASMRDLGGRHVYDTNNSINNRMDGVGVVQNCVDDGYGYMMVTSSQWGDAAGRADGSLDSQLASFYAGRPTGMKIIHNIDHEPENDGKTATEQAQWRMIQARAARMVWQIDDPNLYYSSCYIPGSFAAAWDWIPELQALDPANADEIAARTYLGMDPYPEIGTKNGQPYIQTVEDKCRGAINFYSARGQTGKLMFPEVGLFNWRIATDTTYTLTAAQQAQRLHDDLWTWGQANDLHSYYYFSVTDISNPRGDSRYLETDEECLEYGKLIRGDYYQ